MGTSELTTLYQPHDPSSMGTPLQAGNMTSLLEQAARQGADLALQDMREARKLGRSDVGKASPAIAALLKKYRSYGRYTQAQLASAAGLHPTTIGKIEAAERGMSLVTFCKIAAWLENDFAIDVIEEVAGWE